MEIMEKKTDNKSSIPLIIKLIEDKKALNKCIRENGDIQVEAQKRDIILAQPV